MDVDSQPAALRRFGAALREWRRQRGFSQAGLAGCVHVHKDLIAKIERGQRWPAHDLVLRCEEALETGGELARLWPAVETDRTRRQLLAAYDRASTRLKNSDLAGLSATHQSREVSSFLGYGSVTILTPLKKEAIRARPVVALEDVVGARRLSDLASSLGLSTELECVPIGGVVNLDRPNLVVICGPRLSDGMAAVLAQDPVLRFGKASDGAWTIHDSRTGLIHRSGLDQTPAVPTDVAYLGRLPRPGGCGNLLVFTGVHPQGSLGVVDFIVKQIAALHANVEATRFSVLVETEFDPETSEPVVAELLTPFYRHEEQST